jgi:hypothetical protein
LVELDLKRFMKNISWFLTLATLFAAGATCSVAAAPEDGVALAIIYDTSGSMKDSVRDADNRLSPKYLIANRALVSIARQMESFTTNSPAGEPRRVDCALFTFANDGPRKVIPMGRFDAAALTEWAQAFQTPSGNTPLGNTLSAAVRTLLDSPLPRKHVLVITDGVNTAGPGPAVVLPALKQQAKAKQASFSVHFVAFDVAAKVFDSIKKQGVTVVGAADEKQLNSQLDFILQRKILLEDEEPAKTK